MSSEEKIRDFLAQNRIAYGVDVDRIEDCHSDMSTRKFYRIFYKNNATAILMTAPPDTHPDSLPGHKISDYLRIGKYLYSANFSVPEIYLADSNAGLLLMEDLGKQTMNSVITDKPDLYNLATHTLEALKDVRIYELPSYYKSHVHEGKRRIIDWFMPTVIEEQHRSGLVEQYTEVWETIEARYEDYPSSFIHADFFPGNLVYLPEREGIKKCGIIDFQGAMLGPAVYDLANLLEDARRIVPEYVKLKAMEHFFENEDKPELARIWFRILATQYHCRVIGQFIKLAVAHNRHEYLKFLPVVHKHLIAGLKDPILAPINEFLRDVMPLETLPEINVDQVRKYIRSDAF